MADRRPRRLNALLVSAGVAAAAVLFVPPPTHAAATIVRFGPITTTFTDTFPSDDCRPEVSGTLTGTDVLVGQIVSTPAPSSGSIFEGTDTTTLTVQYSDGTYGVGTSSFRFAGPEISAGPQTDPAVLSVVTFPSAQSMTTYDASGRVIATETFHAIEHDVIEDLPPLGPSDNDIVRVSFEHDHLTCDT